MKLPAHPVKTGQARLGLPGNVDSITGSALTPLRESVTALPAPAYRQEGGASSRLARDPHWRPRGQGEVTFHEKCFMGSGRFSTLLGGFC